MDKFTRDFIKKIDKPKPNPDPIREVYRKWKEYEKLCPGMFSSSENINPTPDLWEQATIEMWQAIKNHCEEDEE